MKQVLIWAAVALGPVLLIVAIASTLIPTTTRIYFRTLTIEQQTSMACGDIASQAKSWLGTNSGQYGAYIALYQARECQ